MSSFSPDRALLNIKRGKKIFENAGQVKKLSILITKDFEEYVN